jgi:hypothetical protein
MLTLPFALGACTGDDTPEADQSASSSPTAASSSPVEESEEPEPTEEPEPEGTVIPVTIDGSSVDPSGKRVKADLDEQVVLSIDSDRDGELHVHSTPEQIVEFEKGSGDYELEFEQPGVVDVEDHESGIVIVQLQVS